MFYLFFYIFLNIGKAIIKFAGDLVKMDQKESPLCSYCNSKKVIPIFYGYPTSRDYQEYERGNLKFGESIILGPKPDWHCKKCDKSF
ncbi:MAG: hypothetical protein APG12_00134 [Candidatus Methanofastidiosum methylothiophilum]|uniref:Uncharacterized protein n=1 Tax=Candidatus Methanofastidiosum methylothiophilum TaxID=1705564 RepID=A0A150J2L4_9EURY|nr:MAG: hypothetical protein APG12_00134 [Candidatus Methanofastidiosum methylthiophilus]